MGWRDRAAYTAIPWAIVATSAVATAWFVYQRHHATIHQLLSFATQHAPQLALLAAAVLLLGGSMPQFMKREPVAVLIGLIPAALAALVALGFDVPAEAEATLVGAVTLVGTLVAQAKVRQPGSPTVVVGGLAAAGFAALAAFGLEVEPAAQATIIDAVLLGVAFITRGQVTPEEAAA